MIRVVLADDQALIRAGFRVLVDAADDLQVVGEATDGDQAVRLARSERADVVLMDIRMPGVDGLEATRRIAADDDLAGVKVIILTTFESDEYVYRAHPRRGQRLPGQGHRARRAAAGGPGGGPGRRAAVAGRDPAADHRPGQPPGAAAAQRRDPGSA